MLQKSVLFGRFWSGAGVRGPKWKSLEKNTETEITETENPDENERKGTISHKRKSNYCY